MCGISAHNPLPVSHDACPNPPPPCPHPSVQLCDFLETHFLSDSHVVIKQLGDYMGSLGRLCATEGQAGMGEYLFDKHTL